ncbi:MAG: hypothetical protein L0216_11035 [Planctomycetales bacterium]|nr:hypothetical protein [Planctomycetales bacterium]
MTLGDLKAAIEKDILATGGAGLLGGEPSPEAPRCLGVGIVLGPDGRRYLEVRVAPGVDGSGVAFLAQEYGVPTHLVRVIAAPAAQAYYAFTSHTAVGHYRGRGLGTIAAYLLDRIHGMHRILSAAHVIGLYGYGKRGDPILDDQGNEVAYLDRSVRLTPGVIHDVDAALAHIRPGVRLRAGGSLKRSRPRLGELVKKRGAATEETYGTVVSLDYSLYVDMPVGQVFFAHQMVVESLDGTPFSEPGDSGSLVRNSLDREVAHGLLFAGDPVGLNYPHRTFANHLANVFEKLGLGVR